MSTEQFIVMRASAGSGKTYALVKQYLLLALKTEYSGYYKNILAITFTNAAAAEMKERVMASLKNFAIEKDFSSLAKEISQELKIDPEKLKERAKLTYKDMLHHYGQLSILTIDSFTHRVIRSFARDLRLNHDFRIEIDTTLFLEKLADQCLELIGLDQELTDYLEAYVLDNLEEGNKLQLRDKLIDTSKLILSDTTTSSLKKFEKFTLEDFRTIRKNISAEIQNFKHSLFIPANAALSIINEYGLVPTDFAYNGGGNISVLEKISEQKIEDPLGSRFSDWLIKNPFSGKATSEVKAKVMELREKISTHFQEIIEIYTEKNFNKFKLYKSILDKLDVIGLLGRITELSNDLRSEENILLISDFHRLVNEIVKDNDAPFIYERIGNRYKHILIDEFQDTSQLQWSNAIPLLTNSLSENNLNLLVGDAKQSIYRWRGGNTDQFIHLPKVPHETHYSDAETVFTNNISIKNLEYNRRSAKSIVDFNNLLYSQLAKYLGKYNEVYADAEQKNTKSNTGYVQIKSFNREKEIDKWEYPLKEIQATIVECLNDGFKPGDIAILVRKGPQEGTKIAEYLVNKGYDVVTRESFLLQNSPAVRAVIGYLEFETNPNKHFAAIDCVQSLCCLNQSLSFESFLSNHVTKNKSSFVVDLRAFLKLNYGEIDQQHLSSNPYQQIMALIGYFKLKFDTGLEYLLEKIKHLSTQLNMSLPDIILWWHDNRENLYTAASESTEAIKIMTIHKSKGLQFPVVIYPRISTRLPQEYVWIEMNEEEVGLPAAYVKLRSKMDDDTSPPEFKNEEEKRLLDEANVCYVATTRAEERLYMLIENAPQKTELSKCIKEILESDLFPTITTTGIWESGAKEPYISKNSPSNSETIVLEKNKMLLPELRIMKSRSNQNSVREYGELIHECLGEIRTADDTKKAIHKVCLRNGIQDKEMLKTLEAEILNVVSHTNFSEWFQKNQTVFCEREICIQGGQVIRPDRVVVRSNEVVVIDYKTGAFHEQYEAQVKQYMLQLNEMYDLPVKGYLLFTQSLELIEIKNSPLQGKLF